MTEARTGSVCITPSTTSLSVSQSLAMHPAVYIVAQRLRVVGQRRRMSTLTSVRTCPKAGCTNDWEGAKWMMVIAKSPKCAEVTTAVRAGKCSQLRARKGRKPLALKKLGTHRVYTQHVPCRQSPAVDLSCRLGRGVHI